MAEPYFALGESERDNIVAALEAVGLLARDGVRQ
jgi:hypothetical protein